VKTVVAILLIGLCAGAAAQMRHDPLNEREIELLRDSAPDSKKRVNLFIGFAAERLLAVERLRSPNTADSGKISDLLANFAALIDELDDNLDMYNERNDDLRQPLRHVLDSEAEFRQKLKALDDSATPAQKRRFAAALADASDSLESSMESARAMLADQIAKKGEEKNGKQKHHDEPTSGVRPAGTNPGMGQTAPSR
jgi:hypothetical protein